MKKVLLAIVTVTLLSACGPAATGASSGSTATVGPRGETPTVQQEAPSSITPARAVSVPSNPCDLLTPDMAQGLYPRVDIPGKPAGRSDYNAECAYSSPASPSIEMVGLEVQKHLVGDKGPREMARAMASDPASSGNTEAHFVDVDGPGQQAVFVYETKPSGTSQQRIIWLHGNLNVYLLVSSTAYTASLQSVLMADARLVDAGLG